MINEPIVIVSALRTPIGAFNGMLKGLPAHKLGEAVIKAILESTQVEGEAVSQVILGQIMTTNAGPNPARQAAINAGLPLEVTSYTLNQLCGSALRAICLGYQAIRAGDAEIVIAGGQENMSRSPFIYSMRTEEGDERFIDAMMHDALIDPFHKIHTVGTAENIAKEFDISREEQDQYAFQSHQKFESAKSKGKFTEEIVPIILNEAIIDTDESPRSVTSENSLSELKPVSLRSGTVTAGNSSGIADGAAAVMIMRYSEAHKRGLQPMAQIKAWAEAGVDPRIMGVAPVPATEKALHKAGWKVNELDLIESNEGFASQGIYVNRQLKWDPNRVNVNGGAIAMGHPFGASGARIITTLLHEMRRRKSRRGIATQCIGGGMGLTLCLEGI